MSASPPLLLLGVPRSGSTWLAEVLAYATGRTLAMEPDDAYRWPEALHAKRGLGDYPTSPRARASGPFRDLWRLVLEEPSRFSVDRRDAETDALLQQPLAVTRRVVGDGRSPDEDRTPLERDRPIGRPREDLLIKTVNVSLCADVVAAWLDATVVVVCRDLRKVVSSWYAMAGFEPEALHLDRWVKTRVLNGIAPPVLATRLEHVAWTVAVLATALTATARSQAWVMVSYEELVADPHQGIESLAASCGLHCDDRVHPFITSRQVPGSGYETRRSGGQLRQWRERLTEDEWAQVDTVLSTLPWYRA